MSLEFTGERLVLGKSPLRLEQEHLERYRFATRYVKGKSVLDIACGTGYGSKMISEAGAGQVVGVDIAPDAVAYAVANNSLPNITFSVGNIASYHTGRPFDVIVSFETIEHVENYHATLDNLYQALVPGGLLVISSPNRIITSPNTPSLNDKPANKFHTQEFTVPEMIAELRAHGFGVEGSAVFGQRPQLHIRHPRLRSLYRRIFKPDLRSDPRVKRLGIVPPRVIVIVASRSAT